LALATFPARRTATDWDVGGSARGDRGRRGDAAPCHRRGEACGHWDAIFAATEARPRWNRRNSQNRWGEPPTSNRAAPPRRWGWILRTIG